MFGKQKASSMDRDLHVYKTKTRSLGLRPGFPVDDRDPSIEVIIGCLPQCTLAESFIGTKTDWTEVSTLMWCGYSNWYLHHCTKYLSLSILLYFQFLFTKFKSGFKKIPPLHLMITYEISCYIVSMVAKHI